MRPYDHILILFKNNAPIVIITLMIDFYSMIREITEAEKTELLLLIGVQSYVFETLITEFVATQKENMFLDNITIKMMLNEYVLAGRITQQQADEIKTQLGF